MLSGEWQRVLPDSVANAIATPVPFAVSLGGHEVEFEQHGDGIEGRSESLRVTPLVDVVGDVVRWSVRLRNVGTEPLRDIKIVPLRLDFDFEPSTVPRVRHLTGSWHYDACYPPRAFRVHEEAFLSHDHARRLIIGGANAGLHSPILQVAVGGEELAGFFVGFEWSARWQLSAGWAQPSFHNEPRPLFRVEGQLALGIETLSAGEQIELPTVHLGGFTGSWDDAGNVQRAYLRSLAPPAPSGVRHPVSYDHWFGLYEDFDVETLMHQATRAAEIGCEAFCLDACWYESDDVFSGLGNWHTPDPHRFPAGAKDVQRLGEHVRALGMKFGLWHLLQLASPSSSAVRAAPHLYRKGPPVRWISDDGTENADNGFDGLRLALELPEAVDYAIELISQWVIDWGVEWFRVESIPEDGLAYNDGFNRVLDTVRDKYPHVYLEICNGGGQRLDISSVRRAHGNWLSDHTTNGAITRFNQTGALRFWPSHMLNMAVPAYRGAGDAGTTPTALIERMVGVLSFAGDIAQWSSEATERVRCAVDAYKSIRHLLDGDVTFPLPQPVSIDDWDVVVFRDATFAPSLIYAFRLGGADVVHLSASLVTAMPSLVLGPSDAEWELGADQHAIHLPPKSAALWTVSGLEAP